MRDRVKSSGGAFRVALVGVATIMLGGCSETGQFGNTFGSPFSTSSLPRIDKTATGSITPAPASQPSQFTDFFKEAFRPFDDKSAAPPPARAPYAARPAAPLAERAIPPAPIASAPLAPPSAPSFSAPVASAPFPRRLRPSLPMPCAPRRAGSAAGAPKAERPVVVAQGETAGAIAQRFGVPTDTLLQVNGMADPRSGPARRPPDDPGLSRRRGALCRCSAGRRSPGPVPAPAAPRLASKSLVGEEMQQAKQAALPQGSRPSRRKSPTLRLCSPPSAPSSPRPRPRSKRPRSPRWTPPRSAKKTADLKAAAAAQVAQLKVAPGATAKTAAATAQDRSRAQPRWRPRPPSRRPSPRSCRPRR